MSRLSDGRVSHLSHLILDTLRRENLVEFRSDVTALKETKKVFEEFFSREDLLDERVRRKIESLSRPVPTGSREWEILYRKYWEEELKKG